MGIMAFEEVVRPEARDLIKSFQEAGIRTWLATGDTKENAMNAARKIKLFKHNTKLHIATFSTNEEAKSFLR